MKNQVNTLNKEFSLMMHDVEMSGFKINMDLTQKDKDLMALHRLNLKLDETVSFKHEGEYELFLPELSEKVAFHIGKGIKYSNVYLIYYSDNYIKDFKCTAHSREGLVHILNQLHKTAEIVNKLKQVGLNAVFEMKHIGYYLVDLPKEHIEFMLTVLDYRLGKTTLIVHRNDAGYLTEVEEFSTYDSLVNYVIRSVNKEIS